MNSNIKTKNLTTQELAEALSMNTQYIRDLARWGKLPSKKLGRQWRFDLDEVEKKLEENAAVAVQNSFIISTKNN